MSTGVGPTLRPKTHRFRPAGITPASASANVDPTVGWPAMGISRPGVKIRIRMSVSGRSAGRMNVDSEKFISFVTACMVSAERPRASRKTANWLPPNFSPREDIEVQVAVRAGHVWFAPQGPRYPC